MQPNTLVPVVDNSGVFLVKVIKHYSKIRFALIGDLVYVACKSVNPRKKYIKGQKIKVVVVHVQNFFFRHCYGIACDTNGVVVLKDNMDIKATRIKGVSFIELRKTKYSKAVSLGDFSF